MKVDVIQIGSEVVNWIQLAQDVVQIDFVNTVISLGFHSRLDVL